MKTKKNLFFLLAIMFFLLNACKKNESTPTDVGYSYYPYKVGTEAIYQVDSTYYDDFYDTIINNKFLLKEYNESYFIDEQNRTCIRIERWVKMSDTTDWTIKNVWYSCKTNNFAERTENNVRITKLIFPIKSNIEWDGNAYNTYEKQIFKYKNVNEPKIINNKNFENTVTVIQQNTSNLIEDKDKKEIYAKDIGLVFKQFKDLKKDFVTGKIVSGTSYNWTLVSIKK